MRCHSGTGEHRDVANSITWTAFFEANLDGLFQTALLLAADPDEAERTLRKSIDDLDISQPPTHDAMAIIDHQIVINSLPIKDPVSPTPIVSARGMLQPALWPILELQNGPRVCFVLRILLRYATSSCARMLEVEEQTVRILLHLALLQLRRVVLRAPRTIGSILLSARKGAVVLVALLGLVLPHRLLSAATLDANTVQRWSTYIASVKNRLCDRPNRDVPLSPPFEETTSRLDALPARAFVEPAGKPPPKIPGALVHDWIGRIFISGVTAQQALSVLRDYDQYKEVYKPAVIASQLESRSAMTDRFSMLLANRAVITTVLKCEYQAQYVEVNEHQWYSVTEATHIREIQNFGSPKESALAEGQGLGAIWKLISIVHAQEVHGGLCLDIEVIALSREIPPALHWLIKPIVNRISKNSLCLSLEQTAEVLRTNSRLAHAGVS